MSELMLDVDQAGELKAAFRRGGWTNAQIKKACQGDLLAQFRQVVEGLATIKLADLLKQLATVSVSAVVKFVAADHFKVDTSEAAEVKIGYLGDNFKKFFLGKTEENMPEAVLVAHNLERASLDAPVLAELGDRAETTPAHLWELLTKQSKGQTGILLTNGYANVFYVKDINGKLWAVGVRWRAYYGGWSVRANSVGSPDEWDAGSSVFSR